MSPAGIPMFYGAEDWKTCCKELVGPHPEKGLVVSGGVFKNTQPLTIVDLTSLPSLPSYFAEGKREFRQALIFLSYFCSSVSKPIKRDERQHIEYVPSQVFTEYVRFEVPKLLQQPIHGLCYPSALTGKPCYALFFNQQECLPPEQYSTSNQYLAFDSTTLTRKTIKVQVSSR
jgi:hypothetical protein